MNHEILFVIILVILTAGLISSKNWQDKLKKDVFLTFFVGIFWLGMIMTPINTAHYEKNLGIELSLIVKNINCFDDECNPPTKPPKT